MQINENAADPLVTAVIPTRNRPDIVCRAVRSALGQTYPNLEVVVVVDGPDPATISAFQSMTDSRIRVVSLAENKGGSSARNAGVQAARGDWVALLDDDDEWLPGKITRQMECARLSNARIPIVSGQVIARSHSKDLIWPRKAPSYPISEYLLARNSWSYGEGLMQTSTLFVPRRFLLELPFTEGLLRFQDLDWVIRAAERPGVSIEFVAEPVTIWIQAEGRSSVSTRLDWRYSWNWIRSEREMITRRAYSGFIATQVAPQAARQRAWRSIFPLLIDMFRNGSPSWFDVAIYISMWCAPPWVRQIARYSQR